VLEAKSSALPLGDSPTIFPKTRIIIQKNFYFVNTLFYNFQNNFEGYIV